MLTTATTMHTLLLLVSLFMNGVAPEPATRMDSRPIPRHDDVTIRQALVLLGQALNPVEVVDLARAREIYARTPGARFLPGGPNAFRVVRDARIFVNRESAVYREAARKPTALGLLKLAATLLHEQVHSTDAEHAACRLQADFVRSRLKTLPKRERTEGMDYLRSLEVRATALDNSARLAKARPARTAVRR